MITRSKMRRQLYMGGGLASIRRQKYGLGSWVKERVRKLIPNELADVAVKAAPLVAPFQPGIAAMMRGLGRFDQRGSLSDALKQGVGTYVAGDVARGALNTQALGSTGESRIMDAISERLPEGVRETGGRIKDRFTEAGKNILGQGTPGTAGTGTGKAARGLTDFAKEQLLFGTVTGGLTYMYEKFLAEEPEQQPGETYGEFLARRKRNVAQKMRAYKDNYLAFDKDWSSMTDEQKDEQINKEVSDLDVQDPNMNQGGRVGYQSGGISMANTLAQNIAANQAQAARVNQMIQQAQAKLPGAAQAPSGITTIPTAAPQAMAAPTAAPQAMAAPTASPQAMAARQAMMPPGIMGAAPMQDPALKKYGIKQADFDKMTSRQKDDLFAKIDYADQYGAEPMTQSMILQERGIDSNKYITGTNVNPNTGRVTPVYDRLGLTEAMLRSDINELYGDWKGHGKTITGQETFQDLLDLDKYYQQNYTMPAYKGSTTGTTGTNPYTDADARLSPSEMVKLAIRAAEGKPSYYNQGGRVGLAFGTPEEGIKSLDAGATNITYEGNEGPKAPQEEQQMAGMMDRIASDFEAEHGYDISLATPDMREEFIQKWKEENFYDDFSRGPVLPSPEDPINPFAPKPTGPALPDKMMAAKGGRIGYDDGGVASMRQKLFDMGYDWIEDADDVTVRQIYDSEMGTWTDSSVWRPGSAKGGRIKYRMGTGPAGLPGIPRQAPDGMEFDMRQNGGFQGLGAKEGKDDVPAMLAKNEFVFTADAVRGAGDGDIELGAQRMYDTMKNLERRMA